MARPGGAIEITCTSNQYDIYLEDIEGLTGVVDWLAVASKCTKGEMPCCLTIRGRRAKGDITFPFPVSSDGPLRILGDIQHDAGHEGNQSTGLVRVYLKVLVISSSCRAPAKLGVPGSASRRGPARWSGC